jgi:hypothetical protein
VSRRGRPYAMLVPAARGGDDSNAA